MKQPGNANMQHKTPVSVSKTNSSDNAVKRIAIYVIYDRDGILDGFRKYYLEELRKVTDYIVAVVSGTITPESRMNWKN